MRLDVESDVRPTVFGKNVSDLQEDVTITGNQVTGTLHYVTEYTGFSGDPDLQEGNYLALSFAADPSTDDIYVELVNALYSPGPQKLDADKDMCIRITDKDKQYLIVTAYKGGEQSRRTIKLDQLTLEQKEE